jgi:plastocyanin
MTSEIYIKDNTFLPNSVDVLTSTTIVVYNEDSVKHEIRCKGHPNFPVLSVDSGSSAKFKFAVPGRYEISEIGIGNMKVSTNPGYTCKFVK